MKENIKKKWVLFLGVTFIVLSIIQQGKAQSIKRESVASSGSSATIDGISVHQTVGQAYFTKNYYDKEVAIRQGFQQYATFTNEIIETNFTFSLNVYPNPTKSSLTIESSDIVADALIQVTDISGKLVFSDKTSNLKNYSINCTTWQNGCYFLNVWDNDKASYTSKIIITK